MAHHRRPEKAKHGERMAELGALNWGAPEPAGGCRLHITDALKNRHAAAPPESSWGAGGRSLHVAGALKKLSATAELAGV